MIKETKILIFKTIIFLNFISIYFSQDLTNENIIHNYYLIPSEPKNINIIVDKFYFGNINNNNSTINYSLLLLNETEQIFFDFQSEFGCLYINVKEELDLNSNYDFKFCSEGSSNIFIINKKEILEIIDLDKEDSLENLIINISVGYSEDEKDLNFTYSLKVSLRKPEINIFEINSDHKTLCKTEKTKGDYYRCLFLITNNNNENNDNLIIYSISQNNTNKLSIFADYINKDEYDKWDTEYLINNIPNINSNYNNYNSERDFVYVPNNNSEKYIYVSVESNNEENIEIIAQTINNEFELPNINDIKIYEINKSSANLNLNHILMNDISFSLVTLYGKANIQFQYDLSTQYITDIRENKLLLRINLELCKKNNSCNLIINDLEESDKNGLGYIFYISYSEQSNNILNELIYGKSSKLLYNINFKYPIILYEKIPNNSTPININLQLYNLLQIEPFNESIFDIQVLIMSKKDIYNFKLDYSYIEKYKYIIKGKFDSILSAANIYLSSEDINSFKIDDKYLLIYISINNNINVTQLIIGSTISQINNLIYPSERIYHYGKLNDEEKIVYKLKGNEQYHLMRLEFGCNNNNIIWSVKRNYDNYNYNKNDTDLSFVTEKWVNGRELLTMYIERGEDIYLIIFYRYPIKRNNLTNFIFKYINSAKNGDFKDFIVKDDSLNYDIDSAQLEVNKLKNMPNFNQIKYYLRIIKENDYINSEPINTIALTESKSNLTLTGKESDNNKILFYLKKFIDKKETYYINVYSIIVENYSDIEYFSYSSLKIEREIIKQPNIVLIIISLVFALFVIIMIIFRSIRYCIKERNKRRKRLYRNNYHYNYRYNDRLLY